MHHVYVEQNAENFQSLYESNVCEVKPTRICACSDKEVLESHFLKHVRDTIRQTKEGRVEVSLPWKEGFPKCLQFNRDAALAKLTSLEKRLNKSGLIECYSEEMTLWTDSATVLHCLHLPASNFKPFVSTRIQEIKEAISEVYNCFRYVKSSLNPADVVTKPVEK